MSEPAVNDIPLIRTGIEGLDDILRGGLPPASMYLVEGDPGSGKTTLSLQFLMEGVRQGQKGLYVTLSESKEELLNSAASHGWNLDGIEILELLSNEENLNPDNRYTMFHPSEVELTQTTQAILERAAEICPGRLVFDSLSSLRLLAQNSLRYRRQVLALKQHFSAAGCTVVLVDDKTGEAFDIELHSICHGVISLERMSPEYGTMRRRLQVVKLRGRKFREGYHDFIIKTGGIEVFPRLVASEHHEGYERSSIKSGIEELDTLLAGGLSRGTSNLIMGPAGAGKSSIAAQYAIESARQGHCAVIYMFDESKETFYERTKGLGVELEPLVESGILTIRQVDPAELSPGEFIHDIRRRTEHEDCRIVVIDSLNGYLHAMPSEKLLMTQLHEVLAYLGQRGVTTILVMAQHGLVGVEGHSPIEMSYLADTVLLLRYFESAGAVYQAISVIKKRTGSHERTIRQLVHTENGMKIGEPLTQFEGILSGLPRAIQTNVLQEFGG